MRDPREGLNDDGTIRTGACRERVPAEFEPIISAVMNAFDEVADESSELYLYGSVATGTARAGLSDVDLVAIDVGEEWCREAGRRLSDQFASLCRGVEIGHASRSDYAGGGDEAYGNRVFLRHYCVPLAGQCMVRSSEPFQGDARAARGFNGDIGTRLARWCAEGGQARVVARKTLLAAPGLSAFSTVHGPLTVPLPHGGGARSNQATNAVPSSSPRGRTISASMMRRQQRSLMRCCLRTGSWPM